MEFKSLVRYPIDIRRARRLLAEKAIDFRDLPERPITLDLRTSQLLFDCGRHLASLAHYAHRAGSPFYVRCSQMLLAGMARKFHGRELLADPHAAWIEQDRQLPESSLVLSDYPSQSSDPRVQMKIGRELDRSIPVMPYPMHPATLRHHTPADLIPMRGNQQRSGIFFAGNQKPKYGDARMEHNFGVLSRLRILQTLAAEFPSRVVSSIHRASGEMPIILSDSRVESIAASDWLRTLARAQFFVCCPGSSQPMCHNLIEAMSVGTIPIIEYGDRITPPLRDGENAICFRGRTGLTAAIHRIDDLSPQQILRISRNVATFYDDHLCGVQFLKRLRDGGFGPTPRSVCMPFHERNFFAADQFAA